MKKLAIVTTHPIQYNAPWFRLLQSGGKVVPKVFYTWSQLEKGKKYDPGFDKIVNWDIPLLDGYNYQFVENISAKPGSHHRAGIINPSLIAEIESWQPDAILVFGWNFVSHQKCIQYFHKKIPVLFRGDSTLLRKQNFIKAFARGVFLKWIYSFVDTALYVGTENKNYFLRYGLKESQLIFVPHAVDNGRFMNNNIQLQSQANEWKEKLGILPNSITILYAGKLEAIKNPLLLVKFATKFKASNVNFIIAGNGPLETDLKKAATGLPNFFFIDFQNQQTMPVVYRMADFFMLCSESETWGLGVNEAMACGRAIIVRNTCGCAIDLITDGSNGFIFDINDLDTLYNKLSVITDNNCLLSEMKASSQKIIIEYSFGKIVNAIEGFFERR